MQKQILFSTKTTSDEFNHPGGLHSILMDGHTTGTWKLQKKAPSGNWVDLIGGGGVSFDSDGEQFFYGGSNLNYRLTGGGAGPEAWFLSGGHVQGVKAFE